MPPGEISGEVLEEGCYHLSQLGLPFTAIALHFQIEEREAERLASSYSSKVNRGSVSVDPFDREFWDDVKKEAEGDFKLTFVSEKGFHHTWKSELGKLDAPALMSIYETSKDFLGADPNQKFLDYAPPKGYDPLALEREVKKAVAVVQSMLDEIWKSEQRRGSSSKPKDSRVKSSDS